MYCSFPIDYTISVYMMTTLCFCSLYTTIYLHSSTTIFDKLQAVKQIEYSDYGPQSCSRKFQFSCCLHTAKYHYLFESPKLLQYQTESDLLNLG